MHTWAKLVLTAAAEPTTAEDSSWSTALTFTRSLRACVHVRVHVRPGGLR